MSGVIKKAETDADADFAELEQYRAVLKWASDNVSACYHLGWGEWLIKPSTRRTDIDCFAPTLYESLLSAYRAANHK